MIQTYEGQHDGFFAEFGDELLAEPKELTAHDRLVRHVFMTALQQKHAAGLGFVADVCERTHNISQQFPSEEMLVFTDALKVELEGGEENEEEVKAQLDRIAAKLQIQVSSDSADKESSSHPDEKASDELRE